MNKRIMTRAFKEKQIDEFIDSLPEILKKYGKYFYAYCDGAINAMWELGIMTNCRLERIEREMSKITEEKDE